MSRKADLVLQRKGDMSQEESKSATPAPMAVAILSPLVMFIVSGVVMWLVPSFRKMFEDMGTALPVLSRTLLSVASPPYLILLPPVCLLAALLCLRWLKSPAIWFFSFVGLLYTFLLICWTFAGVLAPLVVIWKKL